MKVIRPPPNQKVIRPPRPSIEVDHFQVQDAPLEHPEHAQLYGKYRLTPEIVKAEKQHRPVEKAATTKIVNRFKPKSLVED